MDVIIDGMNGMNGMISGERSNGPATLIVCDSFVVAPRFRDRFREIINVYVDPEHRRKGHATALLESVCREADCEQTVLMIECRPVEDNILLSDLMCFYEQFGFSTIQSDPLLMARPFVPIKH